MTKALLVVSALLSVPAAFARAAEAPASVVGVPISLQSKPTAPPAPRFLKARWVCHDGAGDERATEQCVNTSGDWGAQAQKFCKVRCLKQRIRRPNSVTKCGVNTFETAAPCP